jgi:hypothetical protein
MDFFWTNQSNESLGILGRREGSPSMQGRLMRGMMGDVRRDYRSIDPEGKDISTCRDLAGNVISFGRETETGTEDGTQTRAQNEDQVPETCGRLQLDPGESAGALAAYALSEPASQCALNQKHPGEHAGAIFDELDVRKKGRV